MATGLVTISSNSVEEQTRRRPFMKGLPKVKLNTSLLYLLGRPVDSVGLDFIFDWTVLGAAPSAISKSAQEHPKDYNMHEQPPLRPRAATTSATYTSRFLDVPQIGPPRASAGLKPRRPTLAAIRQSAPAVPLTIKVDNSRGLCPAGVPSPRPTPLTSVQFDKAIQSQLRGRSFIPTKTKARSGSLADALDDSMRELERMYISSLESESRESSRSTNRSARAGSISSASEASIQTSSSRSSVSSKHRSYAYDRLTTYTPCSPTPSASFNMDNLTSALGIHNGQQCPCDAEDPSTCVCGKSLPLFGTARKARRPENIGGISDRD